MKVKIKMLGKIQRSYGSGEFVISGKSLLVDKFSKKSNNVALFFTFILYIPESGLKNG